MKIEEGKISDNGESKTMESVSLPSRYGTNPARQILHSFLPENKQWYDATLKNCLVNYLHRKNIKYQNKIIFSLTNYTFDTYEIDKEIKALPT